MTLLVITLVVALGAAGAYYYSSHAPLQKVSATNTSADIAESITPKGPKALPPEPWPASPAAWQTDCAALAQKLTDLAPQATQEVHLFSDQFVGKQIRWKLKFKSYTQNTDGKWRLDFDLEPCGLRHKFFSGKPVFIGFEPEARTEASWRTRAPGSDVKISAVIADVLFFVITPGDNPNMHVPAANVSFKEAMVAPD